eukprot:3685953-Pyramimonas_sp.AAC.1
MPNGAELRNVRGRSLTPPSVCWLVGRAPVALSRLARETSGVTRPGKIGVFPGRAPMAPRGD